METVGQRLRAIRKELNMTQEHLAQRLGIGKAALSMIETGKAGLSTRNKNILVQDFNVNAEWIDSGKGKMFNAEPNLTPYTLRTDKSLPLQSVPLYSIEGTAGLVPLFTDNSEIKPINFIHIPNLPKCDGAIYIVGDSMYPLLKSGDIVLYKQLNDVRDILSLMSLILRLTIESLENGKAHLQIEAQTVDFDDEDNAYAQLIGAHFNNVDIHTTQMKCLKRFVKVKKSVRCDEKFMNKIRRKCKID